VQPTSPERKNAALPRCIELMAPTVAGIAECAWWSWRERGEGCEST
jgi:hypothetical protein